MNNMLMTPCLRRLLMNAAVILLANGCAAPLSVGSHVDRSLDFSRFRSFDWGPADALPVGDARLDQDPIFRDHVQGSIERGLAARGFALTTTGTADLLIHYHINVRDRIDVNRLDQLSGYCAAATCPPETVSNETGTLVLDLVDRRTNTLVWRGWSQSRVDDLLQDRDRMAATIDRAVATMLRELPRTR